MHLNFHFTQVQILWTLTFAAHLVLLVVLLGRDRVNRYPWFSASIALVTLRLLSSRLLYGRLPELTLGGIFIVLAVISAIVSFLVLVEIARRAFGRASRTAWILSVLVILAAVVSVLATWGPWPAMRTLKPDSLLGTLGILQLAAQKGGTLVDVSTILLGLLVVAFGARFGAGWRSHTQQIMIGLSTASIAQLGVQMIWQIIAKHTLPKTMADYERILGVKDKLVNANSAIYLLVVIWWIACLWIDEPGASAKALAVPVEEGASPVVVEVPLAAEAQEGEPAS
ncbi:MAG TPA: hypothetical protein VK716_17270 [Terracidiphilus sp.]|jgi:hypothetical protein|nr:hypothetical protein [Terracidiphilus sp.]